MKKLLMAALVFVGFSVTGFAQTTSTPTKKQVAIQNSTTTHKQPPTVTATQPTTSTTTKNKVVTQVGPTKKDGTLDKRYKVNKEADTKAVPVKKDGTPDLRYKENKKKG